MAKYKAQDIHHYSFSGQHGCIECLCGQPAMLCNGSHQNCPALTSAIKGAVGSGWPICKLCGEAVYTRTTTAAQVTTTHGMKQFGITHLWDEVECNPGCSGYTNPALQPASAPPGPAVIITPRKTVKLIPLDPANAPLEPGLTPAERERQEERRQRLTERLRQGCGVFQSLGHQMEKSPIEFVASLGDLALIQGSVALICDRCKGLMKISFKDHPTLPIRGEAASCRCKPPTGPTESLVEALNQAFKKAMKP